MQSDLKQEPSPSDPNDRPAPGPDRVVYAAYAGTLILLLARLPILARRFFDPDELQHTHDAWCAFKGMLPYRDFFEHHTPWYYYLLRPFFHAFSVDTSFESARHFLIFGRVLSLLLTAIAVALLVRLGRLAGNRRVGALAGLLFVGMPIATQKTLEIRPDALALPFTIGGFVLLLAGLANGVGGTTKQRWYFLGGGLGLGAAIMCTQKILFVLPGTAVGMGLWLLFAKQPATLYRRFLRSLPLLAGLLLPLAATLAAFATQHAAWLMFEHNFLLNAQWKVRVGEQLLRTLEMTWPALLLCLVGATVTIYRHVRQKQALHGEILLLTTLLGLIAGILIIPVAHRQYYLILLPFTAVFAAKGLLFLVELARPRARPWILVFATLALNILTVADLLDAYHSPNDEQLARLRQVFARTKPTDLVMDGWKGTGVFRPHAFHYAFIHEELVPMIPPDTVRAFLADLEAGKVRPQLIALDENLILTFGSPLVRFVFKHYETSDGLLYFAKH